MGAKFKKKLKKADIDLSALTKVKNAGTGVTDKKKNKLREEKKKKKKLKAPLVKAVKDHSVKGEASGSDTEVDDDVPTLDILKALGGDEDDLKLIDIKGCTNSAGDFSTEAEIELKSLLKTLNFKKFNP